MQKVMVFGSFDILHKGHENFLKQAHKFGDFLLVCLARDSTIKKIKNNYPVFKERERLLNLKKTGWADKIFLGDKKNYFKPILKFKPQVICLGYDQKFFIKELKEEIKKKSLKIKIVRLASFKPHLYKSSLLRKKYVRN